MRINIWIPDDLVEEIKEAAYKKHKSLSQYLVDLHSITSKLYGKSPTSDAIDIIKSSGAKCAGCYSGNPHPKSHICGIEKLDIPEAELIPLVDQVLNGALPKYSESYRKQNPMEQCKICGKALRINCGH